jgi:hypothetical protein
MKEKRSRLGRGEGSGFQTFEKNVGSLTTGSDTDAFLPASRMPVTRSQSRHHPPHGCTARKRILLVSRICDRMIIICVGSQLIRKTNLKFAGGCLKFPVKISKASIINVSKMGTVLGKFHTVLSL